MAGRWILVLSIVFGCVQEGRLQTLTYKTQPDPEKQENGSIAVPDVKVVLKPPSNITLFLVNTTDAILGWAPPEVYHFYDVNTSVIDSPFSETLANETYLVNTQNLEDATPSPESNVNETTLANDTQTAEVTPGPFTNQTVEEFCHPLAYFLNYTVAYNDTGDDLNDENRTMLAMIPFRDVMDKLNVKVDRLQNLSVEFQQGCVKEYLVVYYVESSPTEIKMEHVNVSDRPEVHLNALLPDTNYSLYVSAVYISDHMLNSSIFSFRTIKKTETAKCMCDWHGALTQDKNYLCGNSTAMPCTCRSGYIGTFCELCAPGYYRTAPYFPCHRCPCASHAAKEMTCRFKEGFLTCSECETGYTGNICHMCAYGYYRYHKYCAPCYCNRNHDPASPYMCDVLTGECTCGFNTTGRSCDKCKEGYEGDAVKYRNCTLKASPGSGMFKVLPQGVIAGICVGIILLICAIVGCVIYWRWNKNPQQRPFWTVELKDDHEGVNFNTVPNNLDDEVQVVDPKMAMEDQDFYERQGGAAQSRSGGTSSKGYARLHEHV